MQIIYMCYCQDVNSDKGVIPSSSVWRIVQVFENLKVKRPVHIVGRNCVQEAEKSK